MSSRRSPFLIRHIRQVRSLASPVRAAALDALEVTGPATVAELAEALGYPADGLYYHLADLERIGLVIRVKPDRTTGAARFDLPGRPMTLRYQLQDRQHARATGEVVATMLRSASRAFRRAYAPSLATIEGPQRNLRAGRRTAWLTPGDLQALNFHLERIHRLFGRGRPDRSGARLHEFTYVLAPCLPAGRRLTARHHPRDGAKR